MVDVLTFPLTPNAKVYIIGGDGTQKGANVIYEECRKRGLKVVVAGIPKTIDNDIDIIDKSFGFDTAVEEAQRAINSAHVEAESVHNGIGLVKLMGRYSGYIAMHATLASRDVDLCLIPEVPFFMSGPGGLIGYVRKRLRENGHMIIVVAEGAGQEIMAECASDISKNTDASGNKLLLDVGLWLCSKLKESFEKEFKESLNLKYIDPTYMIRAIPSNASDNVYCTLLAHSAIHGAMAGYCGFTVGPVNNRHCYIPIKRAVATSRNVNVADRMWARLMSSTNQPNFSRYKRVISQQRKQNAERQEEAENSKSSTNGTSKSGLNGHETAAEDGNNKTEKLVHTGDRQAIPVSGDYQKSSLLTSPVPGEPTPNLDQTAP